jgi:signal transduction histidine kinase
MQDAAADPHELTRAMNRAAFLLVGGALLGYVGAYRDRSRQRLAQLVAWPGPDRTPSASPPITSALAHAAALLRAPRVLVVWEQPEEPFRHVALFADGGVRHAREPAARFGSLVASGQADRTFLADLSIPPDPKHETARLIDPDLCATFRIRKALSAPFRRDLCRGRIFILDPASTSDDNLLLVDLIAGRLGVDLEHYLLRHQIETATALRERERLGRDLHDGLLQSLAAASIQLKLIAGRADHRVRAGVEETRALLAEEQKRIRRFVDDHRTPTTFGTEATPLEAVGQRLQELGRQWRCEVAFDTAPADLSVPPALALHVRHLLSEAVSNAVRHGSASRIQIAITRSDETLFIRVRDNGGGFRGLSGLYKDEDLKVLDVGPNSLRSRVLDLGGTVRLETSPAGALIDVTLPL